MKPENSIIIICTILLCVVYYLADSVVDYFISYREQSFLQVFITDPPPGELISRFLCMAFIFIPGILISRLPEFKERIPEAPVKHEESITNFAHDPNLLVSLSYQIKTPLSAIVGFSELLKDPKLSAESKEMYVHHIQTSGRYLLELINNITDIIKIETKQLYITIKECEINRLLTDIYDYFQKYLKEKGKKDVSLMLKTGVKDEDYTLLTDRERISQIFYNLLENAVSFTDEGHIEFGYRSTNDLYIEFYVKDTGTGFSMDRIEMITDHLKEFAGDHIRPFDTAMLRINITKHLVRLLGGKLTAQSVLWEGSTFEFTIPRNEVKVYHKDLLQEPGAKIHLWNNKKILIAEDVESNFIYLREILSPTKVQIQWAKNGREAVEMCNKNKDISLVLMDILMPEMDGYEAARMVKQIRPDLPVIAQTAYSLDEEDYKESCNIFDKYMIKPIWSHDLLNTLSEYLT